jgi:hemoglobin-like flavoprotein
VNGNTPADVFGRSLADLDGLTDRPLAITSALLGALVALRRSLRDLSSIAPFLADLGARHARYGVRADHYPLVGDALLATMTEVAGAAWQQTVTTERAKAYQMVAQIMIDSAQQSAAAA